VHDRDPELFASLVPTIDPMLDRWWMLKPHRRTRRLRLRVRARARIGRLRAHPGLRDAGRARRAGRPPQTTGADPPAERALRLRGVEHAHDREKRRVVRVRPRRRLLLRLRLWLLRLLWLRQCVRRGRGRGRGRRRRRGRRQEARGGAFGTLRGALAERPACTRARGPVGFVFRHAVCALPLEPSKIRRAQGRVVLAQAHVVVRLERGLGRAVVEEESRECGVCSRGGGRDGGPGFGEVFEGHGLLVCAGRQRLMGREEEGTHDSRRR
jgi:hypothetical protein